SRAVATDDADELPGPCGKGNPTERSDGDHLLATQLADQVLPRLTVGSQHFVAHTNIVGDYGQRRLLGSDPALTVTVALRHKSPPLARRRGIRKRSGRAPTHRESTSARERERFRP